MVVGHNVNVNNLVKLQLTESRMWKESRSVNTFIAQIRKSCDGARNRGLRVFLVKVTEVTVIETKNNNGNSKRW